MGADREPSANVPRLLKVASCLRTSVRSCRNVSVREPRVISAKLRQSPGLQKSAPSSRSHCSTIPTTTSLLRSAETSCACKSKRLAASGGNQSWNRVVRHFDPKRCDYLFVLIADGRRWFIPAIAIDGRMSINLGGPKYAEFEVHPADSPAFAIERPIESRDARGSADVGESGEAVNLVPLAEWVRIPPPPSIPSDQRESPVTERALGVRERASGRAKISPGHLITIRVGPFRSAGLQAGDRFLIRAESEVRVSFARIGASSENGDSAQALLEQGKRLGIDPGPERT